MTINVDRIIIQLFLFTEMFLHGCFHSHFQVVDQCDLQRWTLVRRYQAEPLTAPVCEY